jgi:hypothetical protein
MKRARTEAVAKAEAAPKPSKAVKVAKASKEVKVAKPSKASAGLKDSKKVKAGKAPKATKAPKVDKAPKKVKAAKTPKEDDKWWLGTMAAWTKTVSFPFMSEKRQKEVLANVRRIKKTLSEGPRVVTCISGPLGGSKYHNQFMAMYSVTARVVGKDLVTLAFLESHCNCAVLSHLIKLYAADRGSTSAATSDSDAS